MSKEGKYVGEESLRTTMKQCIEGLSGKQDTMTAMSREYVRSLIPSDVKEILSKSAPVQITIKDSNSDPVVATAFSIKKDDVEQTSGITDDTGLCIYDDPSVMDVSVMPCSLEYEDKSVDLDLPEDATYANIEVLEDVNGEVSSEVIDTDGTTAEPDPYSLAPDGSLSNWNYTLDEENDVITLNYYTGSEENVIVYANYQLDGKNYKTQLASNTDNKVYQTTSLFMFNHYGQQNHKTQLTCQNIKSIIFSKNIDTLNITNMACMFYGCKSLEQLDISGFNTSNVVDMRSMFAQCSKLSSLTISNWNTSKVTDMGFMFHQTKLTSIDMSTWDTSNVTNMYWMFYSCFNITSLDLTSFDTNNVTDMDGIFAYCKNLDEIKVLKNKFIFPSKYTSNGVFNTNKIFGGCKVDHVTYID